MKRTTLQRAVRIGVLIFMAYQTDKIWEAMFKKQYGIDEQQWNAREYKKYLSGK